ncbi:hypothetical protein [Nonomuraea gerenzanensis]|nr:hypothetical protein [Nonomuraea gerenzanensis]UBU19161.1 hypothetical protein LCN96_49865 [Nonomuraea gerenzanensis]
MSTARSPATFPNAHTRVPGTATPFGADRPTTDNARMASTPAVASPPACDAFGAVPTRPAAGTAAAPETAGPQATSVNASTGLAATATRAPRAIPFNRTRNRCMSPVLTHLPTPSAPLTRSSTSDTPAAATGTEGTTTRISTPPTTQLLRIAPHSPTATNYAQ